MKKHVVCVFCSANNKVPTEYKQLAFKMGQELASHGFTLLTGGANVGMMKEVVDGHVASNPEALRLGVMPTIFKEHELQHTLISEHNMTWTENVYYRLQKFYELSDSIVVLPGGYGTIHELMDTLLHSQFGLIKKRIFLFNFDNFWDATIAQLQTMVAKHTLEQKHLDHLIIVTSIQELIEQLNSQTELVLSQGFAGQHWY